MRPDGTPEVQHYVPKVLLRNFAIPKKGNEKQIHVFDKSTQRRFTANISKIVAEKGFYEFLTTEYKVSYEPVFTKLESQIKPVLDKVITQESLEALTEEDKAWLAIFVATQYLRTKNFRENTQFIDDYLQDFIKKGGGNPNEVQGYQPFDVGGGAKEFSLSFLSNQMGHFTTHLISKHWALFKAPKGCRFIVSDNPVTFHNERKFGPYGNIGFAVSGIQIYLPLSPKLTLAMWCPTIIGEFINERNKALSEKKQLLSIRRLCPNGLAASIDTQLAEVEVRLQKTVKCIEEFTSKTAIECVPDNVIFYNYLQVVWGEKYLMSQSNDFELASTMIKDNPQYAQPPRPTIG